MVPFVVLAIKVICTKKISFRLSFFPSIPESPAPQTTVFSTTFPSHLLHEEQCYPFEHLVAVECCDGHVEEEAVQHRRRDVRQRVGQQEDGQPDQDVREQTRNAGLSHLHDTVGRRERS